MAQKRAIWLDALKGWGILFIVLGHVVGAGCHLSTGAVQAFCMASYKYFYTFHIPLFFVIAGMTFHRLSWRVFFKNKFFRLLVPYFVFGMIAAVVYSLTASSSTEVLNASDTTGFYQGKTAGITLGQQLLNLVLGGWCRIGFVGNSVLWFLPALFSVEVAAQLIARLEVLSIKKWMPWIACLLLALGIYVGVKMPHLPWALGLVPRYLPYFILGHFLGLREILLPKKILLPLLLVAIVCFGYFAVVNPYFYSWYEKNLGEHLIHISLTVACCLTWWGVAQMAPCRILSHCGVWSLGIMLMHKYPVLFLQNYVGPVRRMFAAGFLSTLFAVALVFVFSVSLTLVGCWMIQRWAPWMLGMRKER